jgi:hypothetical protein
VVEEPVEHFSDTDRFVAAVTFENDGHDDVVAGRGLVDRRRVARMRSFDPIGYRGRIANLVVPVVHSEGEPVEGEQFAAEHRTEGQSVEAVGPGALPKRRARDALWTAKQDSITLPGRIGLPGIRNWIKRSIAIDDSERLSTYHGDRTRHWQAALPNPGDRVLDHLSASPETRR